MRKLKILFNTSPNAFKNAGGGEIQLLETKRALEKKGHVVRIFGAEKGSVEFGDFDVFHNFNIHRDNFWAVKRAKDFGLPVAISTIYWHAPLAKVASARSIKGIAVEAINRFAPRASAPAKMLSMADIALPNSRAEASQLENVFGVSPEKIAVVHNGVDRRFSKARPELFEKEFGVRDFALYVGRIEERKNVLGLVRAMKGTGKELVIVGDAKQGSEQYYTKCVNEADRKKTVFVPAVPHESKLFESAYAACGAFVLPSWYETPGLAALEAGLAGANLVVTQEGCTKEYFGGMAVYVNPASIRDIREKVLLALGKEKSRALSEHIGKNFLWENSAIETERAYGKILK